ncbi:RGCVC family protein [Pseudonocardia eucalypti]|uniref:RGCVC family protein n=1 Tax=Pseudonocardia eucalypti TaxID=648755 RepID=UPI001C871707
MTTGSNDSAPTSKPDACQACDHDQASHDATAKRFCESTLSQALDRNCICRIAEPAKHSRAPMYGRGRFSGA